MKKIILFLLVFLSYSSLYGQTKKYGERNGYDWQGFYTQSETFFQYADWANKKEWIEENANNNKINYLLGIYDLCTKMPQYYFESYEDENGETQYYEEDDPYPYLYGTTPDQMMKALDEFYSDYKNMNIKILDAIHVCQMGIKGESAEDIDWRTRYYRADNEGKKKMNQEKYKTKK